MALLLPLKADSSSGQALRQQAARNWSIPGSTRTRVAVNTIRDWIRIYRSHGYDGLLPKQRAEAGKTIEALPAFKRADPGLGVHLVIREADRRFPDQRYSATASYTLYLLPAASRPRRRPATEAAS